MEDETRCDVLSSLHTQQDIRDELKRRELLLLSGRLFENQIKSGDKSVDQIRRDDRHRVAIEDFGDPDCQVRPLGKSVRAHDVADGCGTTPDGVLEMDIGQVLVQDPHDIRRDLWHVLSELSQVATIQWTAHILVVRCSLPHGNRGSRVGLTCDENIVGGILGNEEDIHCEPTLLADVDIGHIIKHIEQPTFGTLVGVGMETLGISSHDPITYDQTSDVMVGFVVQLCRHAVPVPQMCAGSVELVFLLECGDLSRQ